MTAQSYRFEPLVRHYDRAACSYGVPELDPYLQRQACPGMQRNVAAVFVLIDSEAEGFADYITLSATAIGLNDLPDEMVRRLPHYPDWPAVLLGRLAIDTRYRGRRLGELLLMDALARALTPSERIAALAVVVDAQGEAAVSFYRHYGFQPFGENFRRLFLPMQRIATVVSNER